jgi:alpha-tubulin suppressor-like RCC1 family protein
MSSNLVSNITVNGNVIVLGARSNLQYANVTSQPWWWKAPNASWPQSNSVYACGFSHAAIVQTDGTVWTWGSNANGQLGINITGGTRQTPVQVSIFTSATSVSCGGGHTAVVLADGKIYTFGVNTSGQLGINVSGGSRQTPVQVTTISSATQVSCGAAHTVGMNSSGTVYAWGANNSGQLGVNSNTTMLTPTSITFSSGCSYINAGGDMTGIIYNGMVYTFGSNANGALGINANGGTRQTPTAIDLSGKPPGDLWTPCSKLAVCSNHMIGVFDDANGSGKAVAWGSNANGALGLNVIGGSRQTPTEIWNYGVMDAAAGRDCSFLVFLNANKTTTVRAAGNNINGQLGINVTGGTREYFTDVVGLSGAAPVLGVEAEFYYSLFRTSDGKFYTSGQNTDGQLGINVAGGSRQTPTVVSNISKGAINALPYIFSGPVFSNIYLGTDFTSYQLDLSTDGARKLSTTVWTTGSDARIKADIATANLARCGEIVDSLDLKYFEWAAGFKGEDAHSLGWLAQDVKQIFPNSVKITNEFNINDFHTLDSDQLIKVLYGAIKHTLISFPTK